MIRYVLGRLVQAIPTALGVVIATFLLVRVLPGDPAALILGDYATPESIAATQERLGLNRPLIVQFVGFIRGLVTGDLGRSFRNRLPATQNALSVAPYTLQLAVGGMLVSLVLSLPAGVLSALRRGSAFDYGVVVMSLLGVSVPIFWLAILCILLFAITLRWLPVLGAGGPDVVSVLRHLILPSLVLGLNMAGLTARLTRSAMLGILAKDYLRTAAAKGLSRARVISWHALRNALIPIVTITGMDFASLMGGAVIMETVFARPGLGKMLVDAVLARDFPQIQANVLFFACTVILVNLVVDIAYGLLDPRIRYE